MGDRQSDYKDACRILDRRFNRGGRRISREDAATLRDTWDFARVGNNLLLALENTIGYAGSDEVGEIVFATGFLTPRELWHTNRLKNSLVTVYRGCKYDEIKTVENDFYGYSWTFDKEVADFFAWRKDANNGHVLTAQVPGYLLAWLGTAESEMVAIGAEPSMCVATRKHEYDGGAFAWGKKRAITSGQAVKMGLVQRKRKHRTRSGKQPD